MKISGRRLHNYASPLYDFAEYMLWKGNNRRGHHKAQKYRRHYTKALRNLLKCNLQKIKQAI